MSSVHSCTILLAAVLSGVGASQLAPARAEDFRVDNAVYAGDQKEPSSESTTIFCEGIVYDFLKTPAETVVFDNAAGRFVLLSLPQRLRCELSTGKVAAFVDGLQTLSAKSKDPLLRFLAEPKFEERWNEAAGELNLTSPLVSYRLVLLRDTTPSIVSQYREFCDWYARLNARLVPGARPPFGRLAVNRALAERQAIASQVLLTITSGKDLRKQQSTVRSEHRLVRPLAPSDLDRVTQTRQSLSSFKLVSFEQYRDGQPRGPR